MNTPSVHSKTGLTEVIRGFKTFSSRRINELSINDGIFSWQSSFHDRIIRDNSELEDIRQYIWDNPKKTASSQTNLRRSLRGLSHLM